MNAIFERMLKALRRVDLTLPDKDLALALKDKNGRLHVGCGCPSPGGYDFICSPRGIRITKLDGMEELATGTEMTWTQFVKLIREQQKGEEANMINSIEKKGTFTPAQQLSAIEARIALHIQEARRNCLEVGLCLNEAKASGLVPHGQWEAWVAQNTGLSKRQAERLMAAAREVPEGSTLARLDMSKITEILALPEAEREGMAERVINEDLTVSQLRLEIAKEKKRSDALMKKYNNASKESRDHAREVWELREQLTASRKEREADRASMEEAHRRETGALRLQLQEALSAPSGISPEAQKKIDALNEELAEAEAYAEEQARLRQEAQQELLNASVGHAARDERPGFGVDDLEIAVRAFLGQVGVMMYMDSELALMDDISKAGVRRQLAMVEDWLQRVRAQMDNKVILNR